MLDRTIIVNCGNIIEDNNVLKGQIGVQRYEYELRVEIAPSGWDGLYDQGSSSTAVDGIIGFGQAKSSMISQIASKGIVKKIFSYCLDNINGGGIFAVGEVVQPKRKTKTLPPNEPHYSVTLIGNEFLLAAGSDSWQLFWLLRMKLSLIEIEGCAAENDVEGFGEIEVGHLRNNVINIQQAFDSRMTAYWKIVLHRFVDSMSLHLTYGAGNLVNNKMEAEILNELMGGKFGATHNGTLFVDVNNENGFHQSHLHGPSAGALFTWHILLTVAFDLARGLEYHVVAMKIVVTVVLENFVWDPGLFWVIHLPTLRIRWFLKGRRCYVPRFQIKRQIDETR